MTREEFDQYFRPLASVQDYKLTDRKIDALAPMYYDKIKSYGVEMWKAIAIEFVDSPEDKFPKPEEFRNKFRIRLLEAVEKQEAAREGDPQCPGALKARREFYEKLARLHNDKLAKREGLLDMGNEKPMVTPIYGLVDGLLHTPVKRQENFAKMHKGASDDEL